MKMVIELDHKEGREIVLGLALRMEEIRNKAENSENYTDGHKHYKICKDVMEKVNELYLEGCSYEGY